MSEFGKYYLKETGQQVQQAITEVREKTVYPIATQQVDGLLSKTDKVIIDNSVTDDEELTIQEIEQLLNF